MIDRGKGILKSAGAFSFICCSPNSFRISGSTTCSTMASAASMVLLEVAEELALKLGESFLSPIWTLGSQMQTFRYFYFSTCLLCNVFILEGGVWFFVLRLSFASVFKGTFRWVWNPKESCSSLWPIRTEPGNSRCSLWKEGRCPQGHETVQRHPTRWYVPDPYTVFCFRLGLYKCLSDLTWLKMAFFVWIVWFSYLPVWV